MLRSRRRCLSVLGLIGLSGILGCPSNSSEKVGTTSQPFRGQELDIVVPKSLNLPAQWEVLIQEWSSQSGATARFVEYDSTSPVSAETTSQVKPGGSLVFFPLEQLCELDARFGNLSLPGNANESRDLFKGLRERVLSREREVVVSPISVPVLVCYYRNDLLKAARLKPPETWEDYHELVASLNSWAPGLTAVEPLCPEFRATTFFARSLAYCKHPENYSVWFDIDSAKPTLNTPGFEKALAITQKTWSLLPPEVLTYSAADCRRLMLSGKAAISLTYELGGTDASANSKSDVAFQRVDGIELGIHPLPGSRTVYNRNSKKWDTMPPKTVHAPGLCGFAGLAAGVVLPSGGTADVAATNLLSSLVSPEQFDQAFAKLTKGPCRDSQMATAPTWYGPELSSEEASLYCDAVAQSLRDTQLVFELPVTGADEFRRAASIALEPLIRGQANAEQTLKAMQESFEAIVERRGSKVVRDTHRRGLGMSPSLNK